MLFLQLNKRNNSNPINEKTKENDLIEEPSLLCLNLLYPEPGLTYAREIDSMGQIVRVVLIHWDIDQVCRLPLKDFQFKSSQPLLDFSVR